MAAMDWLLGVYHLLGRVALTALFVAALVGILRWARASVRGRTTPLNVALDLERLHPEHRGLLASGLEFSQQEGDDPTAGSLELRRAVVLRASLAAGELDLEALAPQQPLRRAAVAALVALLLLAVPSAVAPQSVATGVVRLVNPLSDAEWPRRHDLTFVDPPALLPVGGDFQSTLHDRRGALPKTVEVEFRTWRQGRWNYEMQVYAAAGEAIDVRRPNVQGPFEYRARGGDHQTMPWRRVDTAPAPQIEELAVRVNPPAYTGLPEETVQEPVQVLKRSVVQLRGTTSVPIAAGRVIAESEESVMLTVGNDGRSFATTGATWQPAKSAEWPFVFTTPQGMTATADRRLDIEVAPDRPPTVEIVEPTEELFVLPEARIEITLRAADDLALKSAAVATVMQDAPPEDAARHQLYVGTELPGARDRELSYSLDVASLGPTTPSTWLVYGHAADYAGQESTSPRPLRLQVISRDAFLRRVDGYTARMVAAIERAVDQQREAYELVASMLLSSQPPGGEPLSAALARQRAASQPIAAGPESALRLSEALITEYRRNQWPDDDAAARMSRLHDRLGALVAGQLAAAEDEIAILARDAQRDVRSANADQESAARESLDAVRAQQEEALAQLESMLRDLTDAGEVQRLERELSTLSAEQLKLMQATRELMREALTDSTEEGRAQQQRLRDQAAAQQRDLAARVAAALSQSRQAAAEIAGSKPTDSARLEAVAAQAERLQLNSTVREAADQLAAGRLAQAASNQQQTTDKLDELLERMVQRGAGAVADQLAELEQAEREIDSLREEVVALASEQSTSNFDAEQSRELASRADRAAQQLEELEAPAAAASARQAAERLDQGEPSRQSAEAAVSDLERAKQQLAVERRRRETLLAKLKVEQLDAVLGRLVNEQQTIVEETLQLDGLRDSGGKLATSREADLARLAMQQDEVRERTLAEASQVEQFPVFARVMRGAAGKMEESAKRLAAGDTGSATVQLATEALDELRLLAAAVGQQRQQQSQGLQRSEQPDQPPGDEQQPADPNRVQQLQLAVAQLGLLRNVQAELKERTAELEQERASGAIDDGTLRERSEQLANEQRELTELAGTLIREATLSTDDRGEQDQTE
jgi:hypothetical protein